MSPLETIRQLLPPLHARRGPKTDELVRRPGRFGLGQVPETVAPEGTTTMVCGFCSTGCGLNVHLKGGQGVNLTPSVEYPVNLGMACPKGWEALAPLDAPDRAATPLWRADRNGEFEAIGWERALEVFCTRMKAVQAEHGEESVAFLSTGQITTEEMALLGALTKFGMGVRHGDGNTRQCMATAVTAYKQSFGFDAPPYTYQDFEDSDVIVLVGSNLCIAHPIMWQRVVQNPHDPRIIVVDPRATETAIAATDHVSIRPKSDLVFFYGLARELIEHGWTVPGFIESHTRDFDAFAAHVQTFTPKRVEAESGIPPARLHEIARMIGTGKRVSFWWTMGVNQSHEGTRTAQAIINLALMTGNIGRPGTGANSITGQCNAMGSRLFSNTTNLLGGHDFAEPEHRAKVARVLDIPLERIPDQPSYAYDQIIEAIERGEIKALWVIATNGAHSWIEQKRFREAVAKLDFLVVQDMYHSTDTAVLADLILPAAAWGEKDGTLINSERRIGLIKKVRRAPGMALADFQILRAIAAAWGCGEWFEAWRTPEDAFRILSRLSAGQPCDFSGISGYQMLDQHEGIQWPCPPGLDPEPQRRLFGDGRFHHPDGRAIFRFDEPRPVGEFTSAEFPYILLTGRGTSAQWHTQTRTAKSAILRKLYPEDCYVEIHPEDAAALGLESNQCVRLSTRRARLEARAMVTRAVQPGQVFVPMHYVATNLLTRSEFDPHSRQPSYKHCAVRVERL